MDRFEGMSIVLAVAEAKALARALTSVRRPEPTDIVWEPTGLSCAPPRWAASRLPIAFGRPEPCRRSSGAFGSRRVLRTGRPRGQRGCAPGSARAPSGLARLAIT